VNQCLQLKVSLARWKPPIWRTVLMPATANLAALHLVIQALYGWDGDHLHAFRVRSATYSDPSFSLEQTRDEYASVGITKLPTTRSPSARPPPHTRRAPSSCPRAIRPSTRSSWRVLISGADVTSGSNGFP